MRLDSSGPVHVASSWLCTRPRVTAEERVPTLDEWKQLLFRGQLSSPRDQPPSRPGSNANPFRYGRVSGVAQGSQWRATLGDNGGSQLSVPAPGEQISYGLSTLERHTFGTGQVQSAPVVSRYGDTAYRANGNYGIEYNLDLPLYNDTDSPKTVALSVQTPLQNDGLDNALQFYASPERSGCFSEGRCCFYIEKMMGDLARTIHLLRTEPGPAGSAPV